MNRLEKDNIMQQIEAMEGESTVEAVKELLEYFKRDIESCCSWSESGVII